MNNWRTILSWEVLKGFEDGMQLIIPGSGGNHVVTVHKESATPIFDVHWQDSNGDVLGTGEKLKYPKVTPHYLIGKLGPLLPQRVWTKLGRWFGDPDLVEWDTLKNLDEWWEEDAFPEFFQKIFDFYPPLQRKVRGTFLEEAFRAYGVNI